MVQLTVMTFNIRGAPPGDGENAWEQRATLNIKTIRRYLPDLIGFQELQPINLDAYLVSLPEYQFVLGPATNRSERLLYNAIGWKYDLLELVDNGGFYLSHTPQQWSLGWDAARVRAATWAQFHIRRHPVEFLHINTHLDHLGVQARLAGTRLILQRMNNMLYEPLPVILTGDFNSPSDAEGASAHAEDASLTDNPYSLFCREGFKDCQSSDWGASESNTGTFHGFQGEAFHSQVRMDWILTLDGLCNIQTAFYQIIRDAAPPIYPSDHYPVLAGVNIVECPSFAISLPKVGETVNH